MLSKERSTSSLLNSLTNMVTLFMVKRLSACVKVSGIFNGENKPSAATNTIVKQPILANGESLEVSFEHLSSVKATLAYYVTNAPSEVLKIFDVVAYDVTLEAFEYYDRIKSEVHVRITHIPDCKNLRDLRYDLFCVIVMVQISIY